MPIIIAAALAVAAGAGYIVYKSFSKLNDKLDGQEQTEDKPDNKGWEFFFGEDKKEDK